MRIRGTTSPPHLRRIRTPRTCSLNPSLSLSLNLNFSDKFVLYPDVVPRFHLGPSPSLNPSFSRNSSFSLSPRSSLNLSLGRRIRTCCGQTLILCWA